MSTKNYTAILMAVSLLLGSSFQLNAQMRPRPGIDRPLPQKDLGTAMQNGNSQYSNSQNGNSQNGGLQSGGLQSGNPFSDDSDVLDNTMSGDDLSSDNLDQADPNAKALDSITKALDSARDPNAPLPDQRELQRKIRLQSSLRKKPFSGANGSNGTDIGAGKDNLNDPMGTGLDKFGKNGKNSRNGKKPGDNGLDQANGMNQQDLQQKSDQPLDLTGASNIEGVFRGRFPEFVSRSLKLFGYDLFNREPETFTPLMDIPVSDDYIVGPKDSFTLNVWGSLNFTRRMVVRGDGTISLPKVGTFKVSGLTYKEMSNILQKKLADYFSGVRSSISFDNIRMMDIFIVGEVKQPGSYAVPSTASLINALFYAGGPSKTGSLRNVKLIRDNQEIATVDLYDFLISGTKSKLGLKSQDVILVPVIGEVVALAGNVKRPAIFEIKKDTTLYDVIEMGGGLSFTGHAGRLSLERVEANKHRVTRDFQIPENFKILKREQALKTDLGKKVEDGDMIQIFPVLPTFDKTVYLRGYVKRPGPYEYKQGMTLKSLISSYDQLNDDPYTDFLQIIRTVPPKDEKKSMFTSLKGLLEGDAAADLPLEPQDEIIVFSKDELNLRDNVTIEGRVNRPGTYFYFDGMTLRDLIFIAGNLSQDAYQANAEIARYVIGSKELQFNRIQVSLSDALAHPEGPANVPLLPKDRILIQGLPNWELENFIGLFGEVRFPGNYSFGSKERLSSVLERGGGFTDRSFLPGAIFTRKSVAAIQAQSLREQITRLQQSVMDQSLRGDTHLNGEDAQNYQEAIDARKSLLKSLESSEVTGRMVIRIDDLNKFRNSKYDITLEAGDTLTIPPMPSVVTITGEVFNPTSVVYLPKKDIQHYLDQSGGVTMNADTENILLIKADGTVVSKRQNRGFLLRNFYQMDVDRGDTILVPKDISRFSWLATTKDLTDILFKIASTTGITITAFK